MATRDVSLLAQALDRRHNMPEATSWVNYVRSHDDIGWTFADEAAAELGVNGFDHNPRTADCRISGYQRPGDGTRILALANPG